MREQVEKKKLPDGFHSLRKAQSKSICWEEKRSVGNLSRVEKVWKN